MRFANISESNTASDALSALPYMVEDDLNAVKYRILFFRLPVIAENLAFRVT